MYVKMEASLWEKRRARKKGRMEPYAGRVVDASQTNKASNKNAPN